MEDNYEVSRRKVLSGLGTIGIAGATAGLGTNAYFNDEESLEGNSVQAGSMNLQIEIEIVDASDDFALAIDGASDDVLDQVGDSVTLDGTRSTRAHDGDTVDVSSTDDLSFELGDVKPGDWWVQKTCVRIVGNPGYVNTVVSNVDNTPGNTTEPEDDHDHGELGQYLRVRAGDEYDQGGSGVAYRYGDQNDPISLNGDGSVEFAGGNVTTPNPLNLFFAGTLNHRLWAQGADVFHVDDAGNASAMPDPDISGDLGAAPWDGLTIVNPPSGSPVGPGFGDPRGSDPDYTTIGTTNDPDTNEVCVYEKFFVPNEVGNVIQDDGISYDVQWRAEQARHNDVPSWNEQ